MADKVNEALRLVGEMAFEHGVTEGEPMLYRVVYSRVHRFPSGLERGMRHTEYYAELREARGRLGRIDADPDCQLISFTSYERVQA